MSSPLDALRRLVDAFVGARLDHLALYPARVVAQSADKLTLDLQPDDARIPPCAGVPIRHGIPGVTVTVASGSRVLLGYAAGDPMQPYAALWEAGSVVSLSVNGGSTRVARVGDTVASHTHSYTDGGTPMTTGPASPAITGGSSALLVP